MSNTQTPEAAGLMFHTPAPQPAPPVARVPAPLDRKTEARCSRCRGPIELVVTTTYRVENRKGRQLIRGRHTAPARAECPQCKTCFRLHLIEQPDGNITLALGVKLV